jgi:hypothetical protein
MLERPKKQHWYAKSFLDETARPKWERLSTEVDVALRQGREICRRLTPGRGRVYLYKCDPSPAADYMIGFRLLGDGEVKKFFNERGFEISLAGKF